MLFSKTKKKAAIDENEFDEYDTYDDIDNSFDNDNDSLNDFLNEPDDDDDGEAPPRRTGRGKKGPKRGSGKKSGIAEVLPVILGVVVAAAVIFLVVTAIFGPRRGECNALINQFEEGCQTLNVNQIAGCFKPSIRNAIYAATAVGGMITDSDSDEVLANLLDVVGGGIGQITQGSDMKLSELFKVIEIEPKKYSLPGFKRKVRCKASYGMVTTYINFTIEKKEGEVYISSLEFIKE